jgi:hypothetical protein
VLAREIEWISTPVVAKPEPGVAGGQVYENAVGARVQYIAERSGIMKSCQSSSCGAK